MHSEQDTIDALLTKVREGSTEAKDQLVTFLYDRSRQRAHFRLRNERLGHTLMTTDLMHEALIRLIKNDELVKASDQHQLFRAFTRAMRQVLIDHARRRNSFKRGGDRQREELDELLDDIAQSVQADVLPLSEALEALAQEHERASEVLEMKFFGSCEMQEIADVLGVSLTTVERDARFGLAWLRDYLSAEEGS
jgi:RNA polymerase sigma factor (TIGR02999 family)